MRLQLLTAQFVDASAAREFMSVCKRLGPPSNPSSGDEQPEPSTKPSGRGSAIATGGDDAADPIVDVDDDDDDVPFDEKPSTVASGIAASSSAQMNAFAAATIGAGASIDVMRWRLPGCEWHIYAYQLIDGKEREQYWSHKPQMWMIAVETEKSVRLFPDGPPQLHRMMHRCNAAGIRAVPCGDDQVKQFKTKGSGKTVDLYVLYGLVKATRSNDAIGIMIKSFVDHCKNPVIREAYYHTITGKMPSPSIKGDCHVSGKYWIKLATGANNIHFREMTSLNEIFMDQDILHMTNLAYGTKDTPSQNWRPEIREIAFGRAQA
jgi:hypothetical protein